MCLISIQLLKFIARGFFTNIKLIHKNKNGIHKNENGIYKNNNKIHKNNNNFTKIGPWVKNLDRPRLSPVNTRVAKANIDASRN